MYLYNLNGTEPLLASLVTPVFKYYFMGKRSDCVHTKEMSVCLMFNWVSRLLSIIIMKTFRVILSCLVCMLQVPMEPAMFVCAAGCGFWVSSHLPDHLHPVNLHRIKDFIQCKPHLPDHSVTLVAIYTTAKLCFLCFYLFLIALILTLFLFCLRPCPA